MAATGSGLDMVTDIRPVPVTAVTTLSACSHSLVSAASKEAQQLSASEREMILDVLKRNEMLQRDQQHQITRLKAELQNLRRKGALKPTADFTNNCPDPERCCGRCRVELGRVINRGAFCRACRLKVCKGCREYSLRTSDWVCTVCHKHMEIQAASGEWMNEFVRRPSRRRDNRVYVPAADIIKRTIRRSWTISNPSPRWNSPRGSVEIRPYSSLPRSQEIKNYPSLAVHRANAQQASDVVVHPPLVGTASTTTTTPSVFKVAGNLMTEPQDRKYGAGTRSHSEDVYSERTENFGGLKISADHSADSPVSLQQITTPINISSLSSDTTTHQLTLDKPKSPRPVRVNPLIKYALERKQSKHYVVSDKSESDEEVENFMFGKHRRKPLQHVRTANVVEQDEPPSSGETTASSCTVAATPPPPLLPHNFRSLDANGVTVTDCPEKRLHEKRVSFDSDTVGTTESWRIKSKKLLTNTNKIDDAAIRNPKRKLPQSPQQTTVTDTIHETLPSSSVANEVDKDPNNPANTKSADTECTTLTPASVQNSTEPSMMTTVNTNSNVVGSNTAVELCDIEPLSGTVFRKVTVRRKRQDMRKMAAVDTGWRSRPDADILLDTLLPEGDDYKLVFISSDSSSKEEDPEDNDSSSTASSFPIDDCDWDYFEPGGSSSKPLLNWSSPFGSPSVYRKSVVESPLGSPLVYRKYIRESDTGTDEDVTRFDSGSPASSDSLNIFTRSNQSNQSTDEVNSVMDDPMHCIHKVTKPMPPILPSNLCQSCGANTQYVPVPVPVPIPVPVPAIWNPQECIVRYAPDALEQALRTQLRVLPRALWPFINQAALIWPLISAAESSPLLSLLKNCEMQESATASGSSTISTPPPPTSTPSPSSADRNNTPAASTEHSSTIKDYTCSTTNVDLIENIVQITSNDASSSNEVNTDDMETFGYLLSESKYETSSDESTDSDNNTYERKRHLSGSYDVNVSDSRDSDEALTSSDVTDCDEERVSQNSVREDDITSSGSADTDTDDTGTVADKKPKRFSRVFIVNKNNFSSSDENASNSDTSDNDTDVERDCGIILTYMKPLLEDQLSNASNDSAKSNENAPVILLKQTICDNELNNKKYDCDNIDSNDNIENNTDNKNKGEFNLNSITNTSDSADVGTVAIIETTVEENNANEKLFTVCDYMSSPGLSDVSAESLNSSDVEQIREVTVKSELHCGDNTLANSSNDLCGGGDIDITRNAGGSGGDGKSTENSTSGMPCDTRIVNSRSPSPSSECQSASNTSDAGIRSDELDHVEGNQVVTRGKQTGVPVNNNEPTLDCSSVARHAARYTSLVMITQEPAPSYPQVSVVTSDTTTLVPDNDVVVRHTNCNTTTDDEDENNTTVVENQNYITVTLDKHSMVRPCSPVVSKTANSIENAMPEDNEGDVTVVASSDTVLNVDNQNNQHGESVTVITGADTLSAVICLEEGLADDDSWVENLSHDDDEDEFDATTPEDSSSSEEVTLYCTASSDREDDLRGYHRTAIDFTLHTIVEESCEESEVEQCTTKKKVRPNSATDLEKYFYFGLGDNAMGGINSNREEAFSETSSVCSESIDSYAGIDEIPPNENSDPAELASSRLEKYFLSGFMGFTAERRDSDGSVGSDSEGRPSPEQRRKRLVRARGTGRSHSSSLDNLITHSDLSGAEPETQCSEHSSSSDTDTYDENNTFDKPDGQFDTVKRKKTKKPKNVNGTNSPADDTKTLEITQEMNEEEYHSDDDGNKTPQPEIHYINDLSASRNKHQSRDSGFIGSSDDLIKDDKDGSGASTSEQNSNTKLEFKTGLSHIEEEKRVDERTHSLSTPPATSLTRKDSFNNWSSDEETNLMMCKMRQFFKTMVANNQNNPSSTPSTPKMGLRESPKPVASPRLKTRCKPPQLVYFENELTRLMKTVPGIREDQVREIVEYLSSEDTWSDSYDSSDYTSSDLEGNTAGAKLVLQQQISDSCKQIINKFDNIDNEGDEGDGGIIDESHGFNRETAFVYQKLVASFEKMATGENTEVENDCTVQNSPPLIAKVMHHIGSRLVALMHEVSSGESHASNSPKTRHFHRRLQQKLSNASSTTTEDDDSTSDTNLAEKLSTLDDTVTYNLLPRSKSHDLLMGETKTFHQSGVSDITEERETSDCERFSWRGSFESALLATDSRNKLSLIGGEGSASASALAIAAKRRSAGDLLFSHKSLSREQLDRVRSCGSIGGANSEDKLWVATATRPTRRRSSVPDASCGSGGSADGEEDEDEELEARGSTLPRSLQAGTATTNSLPRLPTNTTPTNILKTQSMYHFLQNNSSSKSARYRPPGFNRLVTSVPKRAVSAPGLQPSHQRRGRRSQQPVITNDDVSISEAHSSPMLASRGSKSSTPSPKPAGSRRSTSTGGADWTHSNEDDIDRLVAIHHNRSSLSSLGLRSDSMASVYSGAGDGRYGTVTVRGQVEFGLQYNYKASALEIHVRQCRDLAAVDTKRNRSDPYVKVYLLPDKSKGGKRKTKVKKHTLNPLFDESLKFHISLNGLETRTLWLTVWHSDMFGRNDFLGEVMMTLENKVFDDPTPKWYNLQERTEPFDEILSFKGDILVGLKFVPPDMTVHKKGKRSRGALHVLVKEAKSLTAIKVNGLSDPFCKSYLLPDKGRGGKQKTSVMKRTVNPVWNHTFIYDDVTLQELAERCLELTVWDHDRLASNEFLGGVRFSMGTGKTYGKAVDWMDATGKEMSLWRSMLERPNFWVEGCLSLRPTLDHRTS